jgi:hypothetical protein
MFMPPRVPDLRYSDDLKVNGTDSVRFTPRNYRTTMPKEWLVHELPTDQADQVPWEIRVVISCRWFYLALMGSLCYLICWRAGPQLRGIRNQIGIPMYKICTCIFWHIAHVTRMVCTVSLHALNLKLGAGNYISAAAAVESNGTRNAGDC